jgi:hypothetical protein
MNTGFCVLGTDDLCYPVARFRDCLGPGIAPVNGESETKERLRVSPLLTAEVEDVAVDGDGRHRSQEMIRRGKHGETDESVTAREHERAEDRSTRNRVRN